MFVRKSKYEDLLEDCAEEELRADNFSKQVLELREIVAKFCPWYFRHDCCEGEQPETEYYFQLFSWKPESGARVYRFYICSDGNHKQIMGSEEYNSKRNAMEAIQRVMDRLGSTLKPVIYDSGMKRIN